MPFFNFRHGDHNEIVWNIGEITNISTRHGVYVYSGKHSADSLTRTRNASYKHTFEDYTCDQLRLFPNAIEVIEAY